MPRFHIGECDCFQLQSEGEIEMADMCNEALHEWISDIHKEVKAFPAGEPELQVIRDSVTAEILSRGLTPEGF